MIGIHVSATADAGRAFRTCDPSLSRLLHAMLLKDPATRPSMNDVAQTLKALGNLSSEGDADASSRNRTEAGRARPASDGRFHRRRRNQTAAGGLRR